VDVRRNRHRWGPNLIPRTHQFTTSRIHQLEVRE
jgi:hypothetical protein